MISFKHFICIIFVTTSCAAVGSLTLTILFPPTFDAPLIVSQALSTLKILLVSVYF